MAARSKAKKPISMALQGGGAHGAFTWGVLDRILEDGRLDIKAITATSAGAMNAVAMAAGWAQGGADGARHGLQVFWRNISQAGAPFAPFSQAPPMPEEFKALNPFAAWTPSAFASALSNFASPYDLNPFDLNPLRDVVEHSIDFDAIRNGPIELFLSATHVETGRARVFTGEEVGVDATLASACLPQTFKAVEIDGEPYWDGGYMGNPALFPIIYSKAPRDVLLVLLNPLFRAGTPRTAGEIQDRLNEISFNSSLIGELRAVSFVQRLLDENWLTDRVRRKYRRLNVHAIRGGQSLSDLSVSTKYDTRWEFLIDLRDRGRDYAESWLTTCFPRVGKASSIDVRDVFLGLDGVNHSR